MVKDKGIFFSNCGNVYPLIQLSPSWWMTDGYPDNWLHDSRLVTEKDCWHRNQSRVLKWGSFPKSPFSQTFSKIMLRTYEKNPRHTCSSDIFRDNYGKCHLQNSKLLQSHLCWTMPLTFLQYKKDKSSFSFLWFKHQWRKATTLKIMVIEHKVLDQGRRKRGMRA